jgi:hypothetical protein
MKPSANRALSAMRLLICFPPVNAIGHNRPGEHRRSRYKNRSKR